MVPGGNEFNVELISKWLGEIIRREISKPDDEADMELVEECEKTLLSLSNSVSCSEAELKEKFTMIVSKKRERDALQCKPRFRSVRRTAVIAACIVLVLFSSVITAYAFVPSVQIFIKQVLSLPEDTSADNGTLEGTPFPDAESKLLEFSDYVMIEDNKGNGTVKVTLYMTPEVTKNGSDISVSRIYMHANITPTVGGTAPKEHYDVRLRFEADLTYRYIEGHYATKSEVFSCTQPQPFYSSIDSMPINTETFVIETPSPSDLVKAIKYTGYVYYYYNGQISYENLFDYCDFSIDMSQIREAAGW